MVCKRSQQVGPNNVASCWPTMLRGFARALTRDVLATNVRLAGVRIMYDKDQAQSSEERMRVIGASTF